MARPNMAHSTKTAIGRSNGLRTGTVLAVDATGVIVDVGGGRPQPMGIAQGYRPQVGDTVAVFRQDSTWMALDRIVSNVAGITETGVVRLAERYAAASALLNLTTVSTLVPGVTVSVPGYGGGCSYTAWLNAEMQGLGATVTPGFARLWIDGVAVGASEIVMSNLGSANFRGMGTQVYTGSLAAGNHTFEMQARRVGGADAMIRVNATNSTMLVHVTR